MIYVLMIVVWAESAYKAPTFAQFKTASACEKIRLAFVEKHSWSTVSSTCIAVCDKPEGCK